MPARAGAAIRPDRRTANSEACQAATTLTAQNHCAKDTVHRKAHIIGVQLQMPGLRCDPVMKPSPQRWWSSTNSRFTALFGRRGGSKPPADPIREGLPPGEEIPYV